MLHTTNFPSALWCSANSAFGAVSTSSTMIESASRKLAPGSASCQTILPSLACHDHYCGSEGKGDEGPMPPPGISTRVLLPSTTNSTVLSDVCSSALAENHSDPLIPVRPFT